jgi:hypothetical protein
MGKATLSALGWLRRCHVVAWAGVLALLVQVLVPPAHDAHDIAEAFAKASRQSHAPAELVRVALLLLERHQHGGAGPAPAHAVGQHESPGESHHHSGGGLGGQPCPIWQAVQAASSFTAPTLPMIHVPALPTAIPEPDQAVLLCFQDSFSHPQSRAPPREIWFDPIAAADGRLIAVSTGVSGQFQLHIDTDDGGVMKMR